MLVPIGGGGLAAGVAAAIKQSRPDVKVIGVEPAGAAAMKASVDAGQPVTLPKTETIADGLMPVRPGDLTFAHVQKFVDRVITVEDKEIIAAVLWIFANARLVAEPSGAATTAAVLSGALDAALRDVDVAIVALCGQPIVANRQRRRTCDADKLARMVQCRLNCSQWSGCSRRGRTSSTTT